MAHHRDVDAEILRLTNTLIEEYVLDPFDPKAQEDWIYQHQVMHNAVNQVLGISGFDLSDMSFDNKAAFAGWIQSNATEHTEWADILGIG